MSDESTITRKPRLSDKVQRGLDEIHDHLVHGAPRSASKAKDSDWNVALEWIRASRGNREARNKVGG